LTRLDEHARQLMQKRSPVWGTSDGWPDSKRGDAYEGPSAAVDPGHQEYAGDPEPEPPDPWPNAPAAPAFVGLAGDIVRRIEPETEADPIAILAQFLVCFGSLVGRNAYYQVEARRHYPNLFAVLVGRTAKGRKGTALAWVQALFPSADQAWCDRCVQSGLSSGEGLIASVRDPVRNGGEIIDEGVTDKRLLVVEEEFSSVLRAAGREGNILSCVIRQAWDSGRLRTMTRHSPLRATDAHISLLGHCCKEEVLNLLTRTDATNGFGNRFLWICARRSKLLPDGGAMLDLSDLQARIAAAADFARRPLRLSRTAECAALWRRVYPQLSREVFGLCGLLTNRAEAQVLRLSLIYALLDHSKVIEAAHLRSALAVWGYCERSARYIFGASTGNADSDALLAAIRAAGPEGLTQTQVNGVFQRNKPAKYIRGLLRCLAENRAGEVAPDKPRSRSPRAALGGRERCRNGL
jgi:hypothetical protein